MSTDDKTAAGGCLCGRRRFTASGAPISTSWCHCSDCRRATGAPAVAFVGWHDSALCFTNATPNIYRSSPHVERLFCDVCGTPLGYRDDRLPGETYLYTGVFDHPETYAPERQAFIDERLSWVPLDPQLPQHARFSRPRDEEA